MIAAILSPVGRWLAGAAAVAVVVLTIVASVFRAGKKAAETAHRDADLRDVGIRRDIDADVRSASDENLEARARRWM